MNTEIYVTFWACLIIANIHIAKVYNKKSPVGISAYIPSVIWIILAICILYIGATGD